MSGLRSLWALMVRCVRRGGEPTEATPPRPPEDVRIELADGTRIPLEMAYLGVVDGLHTWRTTRLLQQHIAAAILFGGASIQVDVLPPRTTLEIDFDDAHRGVVS